LLDTFWTLKTKSALFWILQSKAYAASIACWLENKKLKCELRAEISQCSEIKQLKIPAFSFMWLENPNPLILSCLI
jgi:hypothetical protein